MLFDAEGNRKYLATVEYRAFIEAAKKAPPDVETFCLTLAQTGARISEVLALAPSRIDLATHTVIIECLKRRRTGVFRAIPISDELLVRLETVHDISGVQLDAHARNARLWPWCRTTAWQRVKEVMQDANVATAWSMPKALRHSFGVRGTTEAQVPLNMMQKWMGHARIETTAIYANAVGSEERQLASRLWD
jgi:integrase/recombinase XerD